LTYCKSDEDASLSGSDGLAHPSLDRVELSPPPVPVIRRLFEAYKHAFYNYSEHIILYYLYKRDQIRATISMKDLLDVLKIPQKCQCP
jgi:hypothetical protein